ncbi:NAD(P)-dependent oxidoreductase [Halioxenophilus sp. WMMB6]|uniref:NAD-dependent epimerase/dehydratase family protein n=1 Tax=Halioxenophilus sp. WMMB6 TaxID=3073815 RepID=UPI00295ED5FF|nr:NAD(P)-dependent oxidoreductase [Halioxenophilus sp. WMMB6]
MSESITILISGALGQVGKRCTDYLLESGHSVIAVDIESEKSLPTKQELEDKWRKSNRLTISFSNLLDRDVIAALFSQYQPDTVIHLAAIVSPPCYRNPDMARRVNVEGTEILLQAARQLSKAPLFVMASSAAVYGSINPFKYKALITPETPINPIDCYGIDKADAEQLVMASGLSYAILRLGGVMSPDTLTNKNADYEVLMRATPSDNRLHGIDARDAALAFAHAATLPEEETNKIYLIAGNESYALLSRDLEDDLMATMGIGRLGHEHGLKGDPDDDDGWAFTGWFDTSDAERVLKFQKHNWSDTCQWLASTQPGIIRLLLKLAGPLIRHSMKKASIKKQQEEQRGPFADPWGLIGKTYGDHVLVARKRA